MIRVFLRTRISATTLMLLGTFATMIYLLRDIGALHFQEAVTDDGNQETFLTQNASQTYSWPPCEKNANAANIRDFTSLPIMIQNFINYQHCRHFPMLLDVPDKCGRAGASDGVFLLLAIKSAPQNYENREVLRKTWAQERLLGDMLIRRLFLTGTTESGFKKARWNQLLEHEQQKYGDILQWDFEDTFFNLTLKQVLFLQWIDKNCPLVRFLLDGDDDVFVHTDNVVHYLQGLESNDGDRHLFTGHVIADASPLRLPSSKYYVPPLLHAANAYPPYCSGAGFLLSGYTAMAIHKMSAEVPLLPIDDVYLAMCLAKAGLRPVRHMGIKPAGLNIPSQKLDEYDPCMFRDVLLVHRFLPAQIYLMWQRVNQPDLKCSSSVKH